MNKKRQLSDDVYNPSMSEPLNASVTMVAVLTSSGPETNKNQPGMRRMIILIISFFFLSLVHAAFISYNCGYVSMTDVWSSPLYSESSFATNRSIIDWNSHDLPLADRRFDLSTSEKGWSFAAGFAGAMFGVPVLNVFVTAMGIHKTLSMIGIMVAVGAALIPILVTNSFVSFVIVRFITGTSLAVLFAAAGDVVSRWAPLSERGLWISVLSGHLEFSPLLAMPLAGFVGTSFSWPAIYYVHAVLAGVVTVMWIVFYRDEPEKVSFIKPAELKYMNEGKHQHIKGEEPSVPIQKIFSTPVILSIWIGCIGYYYAVQFSITFSLLYYSGALHFNPALCGLVTMIPLGVLLVIKFVVGHVSDKLTLLSELNKIRMFNSIAFVGSAIFFLLASFRDPDGTFVDVLCVVLPICALGFHSAGFPKCAVLVAKQYSAQVFSYMQIFGCGSLVAGSFVVPALTPGGTHEEWKTVFRLYAAVLILSNCIFVYFASDKPCYWTEIPKVEQFPEDVLTAEEAPDIV